MANTIHIDIVSPEGEVHSGEATMVFAPASGGKIGIATLKPGEVRVQMEGGEEHVFWVGGGALEVQPHLPRSREQKKRYAIGPPR